MEKPVMAFYLLDAAGVLLLLIPLLLFMLVCCFLEGYFVFLFKVTDYYLKGVGHATIVNLLSAGAVYLLVSVLKKSSVDTSSIFTLLAILCLCTILIETVLLKLLNRRVDWSRILVASFVMNLITYAIVYLIMQTL